jgi:hypothetical protein
LFAIGIHYILRSAQFAGSANDENNYSILHTARQQPGNFLTDQLTEQAAAHEKFYHVDL